MTAAHIRLDSAEGEKCTTYTRVTAKKRTTHTTIRPPRSLPSAPSSSRRHDKTGRKERERHFSPSQKQDIVRIPPFCIEAITQVNAPELLKQKMLWLCDEIRSTGGLSEEGSPVSMEFVRALISMRGSDAINRLVRLNVIEKCGNHRAGHKCRRYRFTNRNKHLCNYKLTSASVIRNRADPERRMRAQLTAAKLPLKLREDLKQFNPSPEFLPAITSYISDKEALGTNTKTMCAKRDFIMSGQFKISAKKSRMTNHILGLPPELRQHFTVNGERALELDLPNSHPSFLPIIFPPPEGAEDDVKEEHEEFTQLARSGRFYESTEDCWATDRLIFKDYCHKGAKDLGTIDLKEKEFLSLKPRAGIKLCWQVIFNGKSNPNRLFTTNTWTKFSHMFPNIAARMSAYKRTCPPALGDELRKREARMVADIAGRLSAPCITLYDGFMCQESAAEELIEICREITPKHLGFIHLPTIAISKA